MNALCDTAMLWREASSRLRHDWLKNEIILTLDHYLDDSGKTISGDEMHRVSRWGGALAEAYRLAVDADYALSPARCAEHTSFSSLPAEHVDAFASILDQAWRTQFAITEQTRQLRLNCAECILLLERLLGAGERNERSFGENSNILEQLRARVAGIAASLKAIDSCGRVILPS